MEQTAKLMEKKKSQAYYSDLQLTLAVASGVVVGAGLMLALTLKEDKFDIQPPLYRRDHVSG